MSGNGKDEKVWDAIQVLEAEVAELKDALTYAIRLTVSLANAAGYVYKTEETDMEDGKKSVKGWFEKRENKSHLILP